MVNFNSLFATGGLSLDRLRNFDLIAQAGGLSKAAGGDPARMSLFSKQVRELESFFGVALTQRQGRRVKLTAAGEQLARLAHAQLTGLEDFQQRCQSLPQTISLGSGNSLIQWLVMPKAAALRELLPNTHFAFYDGRTEDLIRQITEMSLDVALLREDVVTRPLKFQRLLSLSYSLFLPRRIANAIRVADLKAAVPNVPLAVSVGGHFREQLTHAATKAGWNLRIELSCSSFTHAARAVETGAFGAALPSIAAGEFRPGGIVEYPLPFLKSYSQLIGLVWHPRLLEVRPNLKQSIDVLHRLVAKG